jgi:hypothetical protein
VLHNLRAALENLAFEVARRCQGGHLSPDQEKASAFPICATPEVFDHFVVATKHRKGLYDSHAQTAFRAVQPFAHLESAHGLGVALDRTFADEVRWSNCIVSTPCGTSTSTGG